MIAFACKTIYLQLLQCDLGHDARYGRVIYSPAAMVLHRTRPLEGSGDQVCTTDGEDIATKDWALSKGPRAESRL
jgi:hypothetical protein